MVIIVTFGLYKKYNNNKEIEREQENFFFAKKTLLCILLYKMPDFNLLTEEDILQMDILIKIKREEKKLDKILIEYGYTSLLLMFGLKYDFLSKEKKNEILNIDYSYESCKKYVLNIYQEYIRESKKNVPKEIEICFKDMCFVRYCHINEIKFKTNSSNFISILKSYFLLDEYKGTYFEYRDNKIFEEIKNKLIDIYPKIKEKYGMNRHLDKFLSYMDKDNDYNYPFLKTILDNYYNNKTKMNNNKINGENNNVEEDENIPLMLNTK